MYTIKSIVTCLVFILFSLCLKGQDTIAINRTQTELISQKTDTATWIKGKIDFQKSTMAFQVNPNKALLYSAIFPGLGQIYNKKYWKLPIIYGGFLGLAYAITWNNRYYTDYLNAYRTIGKENYLDYISSWKNLIGNRDPNTLTPEDREYFQAAFRRQKDYYRRYRDLSIIGAVALYALCMVDAYVDAQLFDFDISPDLSLRVEPTMIEPSQFSRKTFGLQCSFKF